jgi:hypothetical protein
MFKKVRFRKKILQKKESWKLMFQYLYKSRFYYEWKQRYIPNPQILWGQFVQSWFLVFHSQHPVKSFHDIYYSDNPNDNSNPNNELHFDNDDTKFEEEVEDLIKENMYTLMIEWNRILVNFRNTNKRLKFLK